MEQGAGAKGDAVEPRLIQQLIQLQSRFSETSTQKAVAEGR